MPNLMILIRFIMVLMSVAAQKTKENNTPVEVVLQPDVLPTMLVLDKPLNMGGKANYLSPEAFKLIFGLDYAEKMDIKNKNMIQATFSESIEGRLSSSQLKSQLKTILKKPRNDLALYKINDQVGYGVFALNDIKKDTVLCFYSGTFMKGGITEKNDEAMSFWALNVAISTESHRGISSFFQHLPAPLRVPDIDDFVQMLHKMGQDVSKKELQLYDELYSIEFINNSDKMLATENIRREYINFNGIPVILFVTNVPIKAGDILGIKYGHDYWLSRGAVPELFDRSGNVLASSGYKRTFWKLNFGDFSYTGDLRPLVKQINKKSKWVRLIDDDHISRNVDPNLVMNELVRVHAIIKKMGEQSYSKNSITQTKGTLFQTHDHVLIQDNDPIADVIKMGL